MTSHVRARSRLRSILLAIACCLGGFAAIPQSAGAVGGLLTTLQDENAFDSSPAGGAPYSGDPGTNMQLAKNQGATGIRVFVHWQYTVPFNGTSDATNDQKRCGEPPAGAVGDHPENYYDFGGVIEQL